MLNLELKKARFYTTVNDLEKLPNAYREVAFIGRSNVGKSSAINKLTGQARLAFTSKTPGRTQHINYFSVGNNRFLVDLPGYGYAKVPMGIRFHWNVLLSDYLQTREALCGLILLMDIRHPFTELDIQMLNWFVPMRKPMYLILTKADKLTPAAARKSLLDAHREVNKHHWQCEVQLFSSSKKIGIDETRSVITRWLEL